MRELRDRSSFAHTPRAAVGRTTSSSSGSTPSPTSPSGSSSPLLMHLVAASNWSAAERAALRS
ncbi:MAG: hypothetical protein U0836_02925 [Pirellulales bacterium]